MSNIEKQYKYCSNCGTKLSVESKFCISCGAEQEYMGVNKEAGEGENEVTEDSVTKVVSQFPLGMKNTEKRNLNICYILSLIGIFIALSPKIFNITGMDKKGSMILLGGAAAIITFLVGVIIFRARAKVLQSIIEGENVVVYWKYSKAEWEKHVHQQYEETKGSYKGMFIFLMVISIIIFLPFIIASKGNPIIIIVFVALLALCGLAALLSSAASKKVVANPFVIISKDGALINNNLYVWKGIGLRFRGAEYCEEDPSIMLINYEVLYTRHALRNQSAPVLIPKGKEQSAENIIKELNKKVQ